MSVFDFSARLLNGEDVSLARWRGQVLLIVNTASACGYTPQYAALEDLYEQFGDGGLIVLAFPCNQFGGQEPGTADEIADFCANKYHVSFPIFAKIEVNGPDAHPLYHYLKKQQTGLLGTQSIKWNFTKFLVNRNGVPVARYAPQTRPEELEAPIRALL
ncbi:MAG: glutathione peroxidase [Alphaproteobacteria bacterium]|nr:glutathione peroxidase [Alphaproteobacteria bacterium]